MSAKDTGTATKFGDEMLVDGSFETAGVKNNSWTSFASVGGWKSDTGVEVWGKDFLGVKATDGKVVAELDFDKRNSAIWQDVVTVSGQQYTFSFDHAMRAGTASATNTIQVYWNGELVGTVTPSKTGWEKASFTVVGTGGDDRIEFREEQGDNDSYGGLIDNASLKATGVDVAAAKVAEELTRAEEVTGKVRDGDHNDDGHADNGLGSGSKPAKSKSDDDEDDDKDEGVKAADKAAEKAAAEKAAAEKAAAEKAAAEKAAAEKAAAEKAATEKAAAEKAAAEKAAAEKAAAEKAAAEKAAAEKAAAEKAAAEKAAAEKAAAEKAAAEKAAAEKAAAEKAAAEKAAAEKAAAEKAAAEKAAAEKAAAEKAAAEKAAAEKAAAEKAAAEKAAAEKAPGALDIHIGDGKDNALNGWDNHDSIVFGEGNADVIAGLGGDDRLHGGGGSDDISGDAGNDTMFGGGTVGGKVDLDKFVIAEDVNAKITFLGETAGYQNALGMYKIAKDGSVYGVDIVFANASLQGSGGSLVAGVSAVDVALKAGEKVGFFVVPNGYAQKHQALLADDKGSFKFVDKAGNPATVSGGEVKLVHVSEGGVATVINSQYGQSVFHSFGGATSGLNGDKFAHVTAEVATLDGTVKLGFEDLWGGGDKDFDDSIFKIDIGTTNAALLAKVQTKPVKAPDNDVMKGGDGDDKMFGMSGDDDMSGGAGNDTMYANSGNDKMSGGDGNDVMTGGSGDDTMSGGAGVNQLDGGSGNDTFVDGAGDDSYVGGSDFDTLDYSGSKSGIVADLSKSTIAGSGADKVTGVERLVGTAFADDVKGSKNADTLETDAGNDVLRGLGGADTLAGGSGADRFVWHAKDVMSGTEHLGVDRISDFAVGDKIDVHAVAKGDTSLIKVSDVAGGALVSIKMGDAFVDVVTVDGWNAQDLLSSGHILS